MHRKASPAQATRRPAGPRGAAPRPAESPGERCHRATGCVDEPPDDDPWLTIVTVGPDRKAFAGAACHRWDVRVLLDTIAVTGAPTRRSDQHREMKRGVTSVGEAAARFVR